MCLHRQPQFATGSSIDLSGLYGVLAHGAATRRIDRELCCHSPCRSAEAAGEEPRPAVARGAPQGSYAHPLQRQLDALRYPAWLLEAPEPMPPKVSQQRTPWPG